MVSSLVWLNSYYKYVAFSTHENIARSTLSLLPFYPSPLSLLEHSQMLLKHIRVN